MKILQLRIKLDLVWCLKKMIHQIRRPKTSTLILTATIVPTKRAMNHWIVLYHSKSPIKHLICLFPSTTPTVWPHGSRTTRRRFQSSWNLWTTSRPKRTRLTTCKRMLSVTTRTSRWLLVRWASVVRCRWWRRRAPWAVSRGSRSPIRLWRAHMEEMAKQGSALLTRQGVLEQTRIPLQRDLTARCRITRDRIKTGLLSISILLRRPMLARQTCDSHKTIQLELVRPNSWVLVAQVPSRVSHSETVCFLRSTIRKHSKSSTNRCLTLRIFSRKSFWITQPQLAPLDSQSTLTALISLFRIFCEQECPATGWTSSRSLRPTSSTWPTLYTRVVYLRVRRTARASLSSLMGKSTRATLRTERGKDPACASSQMAASTRVHGERIAHMDSVCSSLRRMRLLTGASRTGSLQTVMLTFCLLTESTMLVTSKTTRGISQESTTTRTVTSITATGKTIRGLDRVVFSRRMAPKSPACLSKIRLTEMSILKTRMETCSSQNQLPKRRCLIRNASRVRQSQRIKTKKGSRALSQALLQTESFTCKSN